MLVQTDYDTAIKQQGSRRIVIRGRKEVFEILDANKNDIYNNQKEKFFLNLKRKDKEELINIINKRNFKSIGASLLFMMAFYNAIQYYYHTQAYLNIGLFIVGAISSVFLFQKAMDSNEIKNFIKELKVESENGRT